MNIDEQGYRVSWDDAAGIARTDWLPGAVCDLETARRVDADIQALGKGRVPLLVDLRPIRSMDRPAREFFMDLNPNYGAIAMVAASPATRMMANFFMGLKRGPIAVRMFTSEQEAVDWLKAQS